VARSAAGNHRFVNFECTKSGTNGIASGIGCRGKKVSGCKLKRVAVNPGKELIASAKAATIGARSKERTEFSEC
jgi:hypothetical protein